jgi:hypothetical protein
MQTPLEPPPHDRAWLPERLVGTLGSALDRDIDAHLLVCDRCLASVILHLVGAPLPVEDAVPA